MDRFMVAVANSPAHQNPISRPEAAFEDSASVQVLPARASHVMSISPNGTSRALPATSTACA
jgi:hypothetical protein